MSADILFLIIYDKLHTKKVAFFQKNFTYSKNFYREKTINYHTYIIVSLFALYVKNSYKIVIFF